MWVGSRGHAPRWFTINPDNLSGKRLYGWLGREGVHHDELCVTNACREAVERATHHGTPDPEWLAENLERLRPFSLILVCGKAAQQTIRLSSTVGARCIFLPHPAARNWTREGLAFAGKLIREGKTDLELRIVNGVLQAQRLVPF